ncbi:MAG: hypothetical protein IPL78_14405 [Chloroflexi bacterium]|nr:hypothetical protein [Chloroflexota bacterium]
MTIGVFRFGSGSSQYPEEQSVSIDEACLQEGANIMILESVNPQQTNHWIFWDSLHLADAQGYVWQLGGDEAPPNYTSVAYDEFDATPPYNIDFYIGAMPEIEFPAELNDLSFSEVRIHFNLTESQADQDLILFLDTLYATHIGASYFDMRVKVLAENE